MNFHKFKVRGEYFIFKVDTGELYASTKQVWDLFDEEAQNFCYNKASNISPELIDEVEKEFLTTSTFTLLNRKELISQIVKALCLHIAQDCNLCCSYCFAKQGNFGKKKSLMPEEIAKEALLFLVKSSGERVNLEVDFFGGEPLLNFSVVSNSIRYARELEKRYNKKFRFTLTTNGTIKTKEFLKLLEEEDINLILSLDGPESVHNKFRHFPDGSGSYQVVINNIKEFLKVKKDSNYYIRGTFTRETPHFASSLAYLAELGLQNISLEPAVGSKDDPFVFKIDDIPFLLEEYERLLDVCIEKKINFFHFNLNIYRSPCIYKRIKGCGAGSEYLTVTPEGFLYPCHQLVGRKEFLLGNVKKGIFFKEVKESFISQDVFARTPCNNCWAKFLCSGGCLSNAYNYWGDFSRPHPVECALQKKRLELALYLASKQRSEIGSENKQKACKPASIPVC